MFGLSPGELMIVGVVAILLFGSNLPNVARSLGKSYNEFRRGMNDLQDQFRYADAPAAKGIRRSTGSPAGGASDDAAEPPRKPSAPKFVPPGLSESDKTPSDPPSSPA